MSANLPPTSVLPMPNRHRYAFLLTLLALSGSLQSAAPGDSPPQTAAAAPALAANYPSFKVDVQLTAAAQERLNKSGNKIGVSFEFGTELGPDSPNMISKLVELEQPGVIDTESFGFAADDVAKLGEEYDAQAGGFSISETDLNFLDCGSVFGSITALRGQTIVMSCDVLKLD
ncbi:MAG: hypothetical protein IPK97_14195 [Ahniella sp.]|nr:hypothetical protein [Ahniella sp.]